MITLNKFYPRLEAEFPLALPRFKVKVGKSAALLERKYKLVCGVAMIKRYPEDVQKFESELFSIDRLWNSEEKSSLTFFSPMHRFRDIGGNLLAANAGSPATSASLRYSRLAASTALWISRKRLSLCTKMSWKFSLKNRSIWRDCSVWRRV